MMRRIACEIPIKQALKRIGPINSNEIMGFTPQNYPLLGWQWLPTAFGEFVQMP
jgi:hypothetical protein